MRKQASYMESFWENYKYQYLEDIDDSSVSTESLHGDWNSSSAPISRRGRAGYAGPFSDRWAR
eukprot:7201427-Pyramimonas_sp.AAC.1